jgi:hypothetical protein
MMEARRVVLLSRIDDTPRKVNALIPIQKMGRRKMMMAYGVCEIAAKRMLDQFVILARRWAIW